MNHKMAAEAIKVINGLLKEWSDNGSVSELEYDLLLDKIKGLYEEVKFSGCNVGESNKEEDVHEAEITEEVEQKEIYVKVESLRGSDVESVGECMTDGSSAQHRAHRETVRALYDSAKETTIETQSDAIQSESPSDPFTEPVQEPRKQVLGEVINNGGQTIGDTYSAPADNIASKALNGNIASLRNAIGLNDKYLMIRDLFKGDASAYEQAIDHLDAFESIEDALLYIHDNHKWSADNETAKMLIELLSKKLL